ncbi:reductase-like, partial [Tropilaelaps mercedesae]
CNIRVPNEVKSLISSAIKELGRLDYLVNNGGGQFIQPAEAISPKGWNAVVDTNLTGTFYMCQEAFNQWMEKHGGSIVNITMDVYRGTPYMAHSGAARAGVENLTRSLAIEWAEAGVRVNAVAPGNLIYSQTAEKNYGSVNLFAHMIPYLPSKRLGLPEEISPAVAFLLSDGASLISGQVLGVDAASRYYSRLLKEIPDHDRWPKPPSAATSDLSSKGQRSHDN